MANNKKCNGCCFNNTFYQLHIDQNTRKLNNYVGLSPFLSMEINGIDTGRVMELLSTIKEERTVQVTHKDKDKVEISISEAF